MAMNVIGKRVGTFTDKKTGEVITFGKIFVVYPADESMKGAQGEIAEAISVKPEMAAQIPVGSNVELLYNKYGKVNDFNIVSPAK